MYFKYKNWLWKGGNNKMMIIRVDKIGFNREFIKRYSCTISYASLNFPVKQQQQQQHQPVFYQGAEVEEQQRIPNSSLDARPILTNRIVSKHLNLL